MQLLEKAFQWGFLNVRQDQERGAISYPIKRLKLPLLVGGMWPLPRVTINKQIFLFLLFLFYSNCFLSSALLGNTALYSFGKMVLLSSGKVNSITVLFSCLQSIMQ